MFRAARSWLFGCLLPILLAFSSLVAATALPVGEHLKQLLAAGRQGALPGVMIEHWSELQRLYEQRDWQLVWSDVNGAPRHERREQLAAWITLSHAHGLNPRDYGHERLQLLNGMDEAGSAPGLSSEALLNDLLMSHAFIRLAQDLSGSRLDLRQIDPLWRLPAKVLDPVELLRQLDHGLGVDQLLRGLLPRSDEYNRLVDLHVELAEQTFQPFVPPLLPTGLVRIGDRSEGVVELRGWLSHLGLLNAAQSSLEDERTYSVQVADAVRRFQQQQGLKVDGIFGPDTRAAMLLSPAHKLQQVRANLARWRALPASLGERYLLVRTAAFSLDLVEQGAVTERHSIISGRPARPSLSFAANVDRLILHPPWTVPFRLAVEDLLPKQQQDPDYFTRLGIEVLAQQDGHWTPVDSASIDWSGVSRHNFHYLLRQQPGPHNSLGQIRFGMANPHSIFLHDTPQQSLFDEPLRAFSSGCIRVQGIGQLAQTLLGEESLELELSKEGTRHLLLDAPLPVYLVYLSVWVDESGQPYFYPDLYGADARMNVALGPLPTPLSPAQLQLAQKLLKK
ncbi:L,D-transpeptidase family protein [Marinobacterium sediminicola]|uniref:Murein L,D-transpeptidase YcbB/YkuD n=1 Tax=Marinobacterium sediminicola TaxID=518898 RepID=A0ABY1S0C9_9GAMM|nr:peptidoglycan-binding protein [Marinobacterium sediminicola]ULG69613.1 L,D-transpeptidase family protein [Marinobacterium sediminicola]SMR74659.1 Murein L,D-transpeptidase YcbB/YkuD [Marinobacterium sediminicola]